jgi:hypothetical protein
MKVCGNECHDAAVQMQHTGLISGTLIHARVAEAQQKNL